MQGMRRTIFRTAALVAAGLLMPAVPAGASAFVAWQVTGVSYGDTLNVRAYPSNGSAKQAAYPNGTVLSMTGRCTGGVDLMAIQAQAAWKQRAAVRKAWCQVWHDPAQNGNYVSGWVYGRYIRPR